LRLYSDLAKWWPLCSSPEEYKEEAGIYRRALLQYSPRRPVTVLELGSGGGNNASHLKRHFKMTLVDLSRGMLRVSRKLNPDCTHVHGDMRTIRLKREFDAVFIHDAIDYMLTLDDLRQAIETAFVHCRPGGVALFVPDETSERFRPSSGHGGHDAGDRGLRYLEWTIDPDPQDGRYTLYMSYLLREGGRVRHVGLDEHTCGLFAERDWMNVIRHAGFKPRELPYEHSTWERHARLMFLGVKPDHRSPASF
jgi:SAM-dependent methyltransferase